MLGKWIDEHDKQITYSYKAFRNSEDFEGTLDSIVLEVKDIRKETELNTNYSKLTGGDSKLNRRFVRSYVLRFLQVFLYELAKGNTVIIGNKEIGFSFNSQIKKRLMKGKIIEYSTLRVYVHISKKLFSKTMVFYYSHVDKRFQKAFKEVRKNIKYIRYPSNFLEE